MPEWPDLGDGRIAVLILGALGPPHSALVQAQLGPRELKISKPIPDSISDIAGTLDRLGPDSVSLGRVKELYRHGHRLSAENHGDRNRRPLLSLLIKAGPTSGMMLPIEPGVRDDHAPVGDTSHCHVQHIQVERISQGWGTLHLDHRQLHAAEVRDEYDIPGHLRP